MKALKIAGIVQLVETQKDIRLIEYILGCAKGCIEVISMPADDAVMYVDREAQQHGKPRNNLASLIAGTGIYGFEVMGMEDIRKHAEKYSQSYSSGYSPWKTNFEEMAKKTVLKRCLKYAPLRSDVAAAITGDGGIRHELSDNMNDVPAEFIAAEAVEVVAADAEVQEVSDAE